MHINQIAEIKSHNLPVSFVGDVVGTGSSRKSATNSVLWFFGEDLPGVPNKRSGGICFGTKVAPIFFNTMEDAGALVFEASVDDINHGDIITILPYDGKILDQSGEIITEFSHKSEVILDEVRAGGRINLIVGRGLTQRAREHLKLPASEVFREPQSADTTSKGFTLALKYTGPAAPISRSFAQRQSRANRNSIQDAQRRSTPQDGCDTSSRS